MIDYVYNGKKKSRSGLDIVGSAVPVLIDYVTAQEHPASAASSSGSGHVDVRQVAAAAVCAVLAKMPLTRVTAATGVAMAELDRDRGKQAQEGEAQEVPITVSRT